MNVLKCVKDVFLFFFHSGGFSIGFVAYPKALSYFPFPQIWCVLFYLVLLLPGIDAMVNQIIFILNKYFLFIEHVKCLG